MQQVHGTVMHYAWGTTDAIPALLDIPPDGRPYAEYWLGAHPLAPSRLDDRTLDDVVGAGPEIVGEPSFVEFGAALPFLMKVLSARHALSLQAHPNREQAREGYQDEQRRGIALDAPERVYRDAWPKPEMVLALSEFHSMYGFREPRETCALLAQLGVDPVDDSVLAPLVHRSGEAALAEVFLAILTADDRCQDVLNRLAASALRHADDPEPLGSFARTILDLDAHFPGDPGILAALLLNRVTLQPGEAIEVAPGHLHLHLRGTCLEAMANSDNVVRGGLTAKHIDVVELLRVVTFMPTSPALIEPVQVSPGVTGYPTSFPEFEMWQVAPSRETPVAVMPGDGAARIALALEGHLTVHTPQESLTLRQGEAAFLDARDVQVQVAGDGVLYVACTQVR